MRASYASLCLLGYNRPDFLRDAVRTAVDNAGHPCEVIVHDDGSGPDGWDAAASLLREGAISRLVAEPPGRNEGVGTAFNRAAAVATGDPVVKLDQDLIFEPGWLARVVRILDRDERVGMVGLFKYGVDPVDWRKMNHRAPANGADYDYVDDFVGSAMAIPRSVLDAFGPLPEHSDAFAEDLQYKTTLRGAGLELVLPHEDLARNRGFGPGPSTVVYMEEGGRVGVSKIHHSPLVFGR